MFTVKNDLNNFSTYTKMTPIMPSYAILRINKETKECEFLMRNAVATRTFRNDLINAWTVTDHRIASGMLCMCINKHRNCGDYDYIVDDLEEQLEW